MSKPLKSYHFDVGNSNKGAVGMCLRVQAEGKREAVRLANQLLLKHQCVSVTESDGSVEYCEVYLNGNLTVKDIDEVNVVRQRKDQYA